MKIRSIFFAFLVLMVLPSCNKGPAYWELGYLTDIEIDGSAKDWQGQGTVFPVISDTYGTIDTTDFSASLKLGWSGNGLYFLARVKDDILQGKDAGRKGQDQFEIFVSRKRGTDQMVQYLLVNMFGKDARMTVNKFDYSKEEPFPDVKEIQAQRKLTKEGYILEGCIPAKVIGIPLGSYTHLYLNIYFIDSDGQSRQAYTFFINDDTYNNPECLQEVILTDRHKVDRDNIIARSWVLDKELVNVQLVSKSDDNPGFTRVMNGEQALSEGMFRKYGDYWLWSQTFRRSEIKDNDTKISVQVDARPFETYYFRDMPSRYEKLTGLKRFEKAISYFEELDKLNPPADSAVLFIGSSTIRLWTDLAHDFDPIPVIRRGFGGSRTTDILDYYDRIVLPYAPPVIVYFCGNNDLVIGTSPAEVVANIRTFIEKVGNDLPETEIVLLGLKASISQIRTMDQVKETNHLLARLADKYPYVTFIDLVPLMVDQQGNPRSDIFSSDGNHMNKKGYEKWARVIRPEVEKALYR